MACSGYSRVGGIWSVGGGTDFLVGSGSGVGPESGRE